ncbi:MAG: aminopeptidase, partial [Thermacetogenium sp.]|nr:aminopeptidase [Thermacetogenium sp.]
MQKDITEIKRELRCVWEDIGKLDRRLTAQEERATKLSKDGGTTMTNPRVSRLAENLVHYSCRLQPGEKILIEAVGLELPLVRELIRQVYRAGGIPFVTIKDRA